MRSAQEGGSSGHAESLAATLAEHQQHLASFQVKHKIMLNHHKTFMKAEAFPHAASLELSRSWGVTCSSLACSNVNPSFLVWGGGCSVFVELTYDPFLLNFLHPSAFYVQVLINQLKEVAPTIQKSISECTEKVNSIASNLPPSNRHHGQTTSTIQTQSNVRMVILIIDFLQLLTIFLGFG